MSLQNWYDNLDKENKDKADHLISKIKEIDPNETDFLGLANAEIEDNNPALAEFRLVSYLKKSLDAYDENQEETAKLLETRGSRDIKDIVQKINNAGVTPKELMTLLKHYHYGGILDVFYRFEHIYLDGLDETVYPKFEIQELGPDWEATERKLDVYTWLSYLNPENDG
jgi:ABC-type nitrate/sulfonate/bicarbonate transport system substrate-binding protein